MTRNQQLPKSSEQSSVHLNGAAFVNVNKLTKFFHQIKMANKYEKALDIALSIVDQVKAFLGCSKVMLIPLDYFFGMLITSRSINGKEKLAFVH